MQEIVDEIRQLTKIQLRDADFLGKGATNAEVYHYRIKNYPVAVKCFKNLEEAKKEIDILEQIRKVAQQCPGIIEYYGTKQLSIEIIGKFKFNYEGYVIFLQEGDLDFQKFMDRTPHQPVQQVLQFLSQTCLGLACLHENGCFHGDIKPSNIMISQKNSELVYHLTDFSEGQSQGTQITTNFETLTLRGTPSYLAPELWQIWISRANFGRFNPYQTDVYSLGIITLELLLDQQSIFKLNAARFLFYQIYEQLVDLKKNLIFNKKM